MSLDHDWLLRADLGPRVRAVATTRLGPGHSRTPFDRFNLGAHVGDAPEAVAFNRVTLCQTLNLPSEPRWLRQVHGTTCVTLDGTIALDAPEADAAYTDTPGQVCLIMTADCLPVLVASSAGDEVAAIHAGWRGLAAGVIESALSRFRAPPETLRAWLGPAIGPTVYEVGEEVRAAFIAIDRADAAHFAPTRPGHYLCDLYALARSRLRRAGVARADGGEHCTASDPRRFYSHRRDGISGRMAALIWIAPD